MCIPVLFLRQIHVRHVCCCWLVLLLHISWSQLSVPLGPSWIQHMTALADTHKEDSFVSANTHTLSLLRPALDLFRLFTKMSTTVLQRHQVVKFNIVPAELRNSCSAIWIPVHPENNHSTCILIEQDWCHGMKPTDLHSLCHPSTGWGGYKRILAPTMTPLLLQWNDLLPLALINILLFKFNQEGIWWMLAAGFTVLNHSSVWESWLQTYAGYFWVEQEVLIL